MSASTSSARLVFIDDASTSVQFEGPWYRSTDSFSYSEVSGPIHGGTQRGINGTGRITFRFNGTEICPFGTSDVATLSTSAFDPTWECIVDGIRVPTIPPSQQPQNKRNLCQFTVLPDGPHTIVMNVASSGTPFWFDFFMMKPSLSSTSRNDPNLEDPNVYYLYQDPAIQYPSGQWQTLENVGMLTQQAGSRMFMSFNGTKASWYGRMQTGFPSGPSSGSYSIDNGPAVNFTIAGLLLDGTTRFQQLIFETPDIPMGQHNLTVTYLGASTPLILEYMIIQNGDLAFTGNPMPPPTIGDDHPDGGHDGSPHRLSTGVIVGAVVGGVALLALIGFVIFLLRKLRQRRRTRILTNIDGDDDRSKDTNIHVVEATPFMPSADLSGHHRASSSLPASPAPSAGTFISRSTSAGAGGSGQQQQHNSMLSYLSASDEKALLASRPTSSNYDPSQAASGSSAAYLDPRQHLAQPTPSGASGSGVGSSNEKPGGFPLQYGIGGDGMAVVNADEAEDVNLVHHQDSGIRLAGQQQPVERVPVPKFVDVPPSYTPQ